MTAANDSQLDHDRNVAFYAACVQAWIDTRMERDRSILALSSGGVGLLATLLTTVGATSTCHLLLYGAAALSFISTIILALAIFERNASRLEEIIKNKNAPDVVLRAMDHALWGVFLMGLILTILVGLCSAVSGRSGTKETRMGTESTKTTAVREAPETRSIEGLQSLRPDTAPSAPSDSGGAQTGGTGGGGSTSSEKK